jgi:hypothetical protein
MQRGRPAPAHRHFGSTTSRTRAQDATTRTGASEERGQATPRNHRLTTEGSRNERAPCPRQGLLLPRSAPQGSRLMSFMVWWEMVRLTTGRTRSLVVGTARRRRRPRPVRAGCSRANQTPGVPRQLLPSRPPRTRTPRPSAGHRGRGVVGLVVQDFRQRTPARPARQHRLLARRGEPLLDIQLREQLQDRDVGLQLLPRRRRR